MTHFGPETAAGKGLRGVAQEMRKGIPAGAFPTFSYRKTRALLENLMKRALIAAAVAGVVAAAAAPALAAEESPFSANVSIVSDYKFRGLSQTNAEPALQGGFDYAHASGLYLGTWASSISWLSDGQADVSSSLEWDFYGGYSGTSGEFGYDFGLLYYYYPGSYPGGFNSPDTLEAYVKGSWKFLSLKYSHSLTDLFGAVDSKNSNYLDLGAEFALPQGYTLGAHVGHQKIKGMAGSCDSYIDYSVGVSKSFGGFDFGLNYVDTDYDDQCMTNAFGEKLGKGTVVLSVGKTF